MNKALPTFAVAFATFIAAIVLPPPARVAEPVRTPLPPGPIEAVRIETSAHLTILVGDGAGIDQHGAGAPLALRLDGGTLVIADPPAGEDDGDRRYVSDYRAFTLNLPADVRRVTSEDGLDVTAKARVPEIELVGAGEINWTGDAGALRIRHHGDCAEPGATVSAVEHSALAVVAAGRCGAVRIQSGVIDSADVRTAGAFVWMQDPRTIAAVTLRLPPEAGYGLGQARDVTQVQVLPPDDATPAGSAPPEAPPAD